MELTDRVLWYLHANDGIDRWIHSDVTLAFCTETGFALARLDGAVAGAGLAAGLGLADALDSSVTGMAAPFFWEATRRQGGAAEMDALPGMAVPVPMPAAAAGTASLRGLVLTAANDLLGAPACLAFTGVAFNLGMRCSNCSVCLRNLSEAVYDKSVRAF